MATTHHYPLEMIEPAFTSELAGLIIELEKLRVRALPRTTPEPLFLELKEFFHTLESVGSARIEGNNTTVAEYFEAKEEHRQGGYTMPEEIREIENLEQAMTFVEQLMLEERPIDGFFVRSLQQLAVSGLEAEGDSNAGAYREHNVRISGAEHQPSEASRVPDYMRELFDFLAQPLDARFDLLKVALAHHRFVWIHPFGNGNGRTVRLLTYALLLRYGFGLDVADGIINPTAIFCNDRSEYYRLLAGADKGEAQGLEAWCTYVLSGLKREKEKVDKLCDYNYVRDQLLFPALHYSFERQHITEEERRLMERAVRRELIQNEDVRELYPWASSSTASQKLKKLRDREFLVSLDDNSRVYRPCFTRSVLMRGLMRALDAEGFLPVKP